MSLGVAVIGLGRWGPNYVRIFSGMRDATLVAVADLDKGRRDSIQSAYPAARCCEEFGEALATPGVDAVVIATPTVTHDAVVRAALESGKHVLCEKPLTSSSRQAWELVRLADARKRLLMVGHVFLFNTGIEYLVKAVKDSCFGHLHYLSAIRTNLGPFRQDVNAAWDLASHDLYVFGHVTGERPVSVSALGASYLRPGVEDIVFMTLRYPSGVFGHIHVSWLDPKKVRQITAVGEKKMVTWDENGSPGPVMVYDRSVVRDQTYNNFGEFQLLAREGDVVLPRIQSREPLSAQAKEFVERCTRGWGGKRCGSAVEGAEVVDILEAADLSLKEQGRMVEVEYGDGSVRSSHGA